MELVQAFELAKKLLKIPAAELPRRDETEQRLVAVAVRAGELGFKLAYGEDLTLEKYIKARFQPEGEMPYGRYEVHVYRLSPELDKAIRSFFAY